jgi:hypothetical protein
MLKDKNEKLCKNREITEELWKISIQETRNGIIRMLESADKLLQSGGNEAICAGLYTYAVEEYGKILLLKELSPLEGKVKIEINGIFRGKRAHKRKFDIAAKNLPSECKTLHEGAFNPRIFNPKDFETAPVIADLEARTAIFYCDFVESGDAIKRVPPVDKTLLNNAINKFRTITLRIDVDE